VSAVVGTIVLLAMPALAASGAPVIRSLSQAHRHVVVTFTSADLQPWLIEVAVSRATDESGAFLSKNVRLRERITARADRATGVVRWRTTKALRPHLYYVEVAGIESGGVTDCLPQQRDCLVRWSVPRRVRVR
jgi:hypothetical protein